MADVQFTVNGDLFTVPAAEAAGKTLNDFIRFKTVYTGPKVSCGQGGCGACTVSIARPGQPLHSTASCLLPVASAHGAAILTPEGLTSQTPQGGIVPHPIQERLAKYNGTQCGFCTPGMVMQLFSTLSQNDGGKALGEKDLEQCINGNICRCTGYRPIIECAKSFAKDTTVKNDFDKNCEKGPYNVEKDPKLVFPPQTSLADGSWSRPSNIEDALEAMKTGAVPIAGGTSYGVYPELGVVGAKTAFVDLRGIEDGNFMKVTIESGQIQVGAGVTWTSFVEQLGVQGAGVSNPQPLQELIARCGSIAGSQVRNNATLGGNVTITRNKGFLSDWVPLLASLGATVKLATAGGALEHELLAFVKESGPFEGLITSVSFPLPAKGVVFKAYRVAKRSRNAHALVNAGFVATIADDTIKEASIVLGAVDPKPVRLGHLERALIGVSASELQRDASSVLSTVTDKMRSGDFFQLECGFGREQTDHIISGFVVKFLTALFPQAVPKTWASAEYCLHDMERRTSSTQTFPEPTKLGGALNQPLPKTTACQQAMGLTKFLDDMPKPKGLLVAAFVCVPEACAKVSRIDDAVAKEMLGSSFHSIYTYEDLFTKAFNAAGYTGFTGKQPDYKEEHKAFVGDEDFLLPFDKPSNFAGQPVAILLAESDAPKLVEMAATRISESLELERVGGIEIGDLVTSPDLTDAPLVLSKGYDKKGNMGKVPANLQKVKGKFSKKSQQNFYLENQSMMAIPDEEGLTVYVSCQAVDMAQRLICGVTGLPQSKVVVKSRRLGGGFGGKMVRPTFWSGLTSQAALKTGKPVRLVLPKDVDMRACGGRQAIEAQWDVGVDAKTGKISSLEYELWLEHGCTEDTQKINAHIMGSAIDMNYAIPNMKVTVHLSKHNVAQRTAVRAPGHYEACALIEAVMDGVGQEIGLPGHKVREANHYQSGGAKINLTGGLIPQGTLEGYSNLALWEHVKQKTEFEKRLAQIQDFNKNNSWKKRGIAMTSARYGVFVSPGNVVRIDIFRDGSVNIAMGGCEMGQGLHTKVAQIVTTHFHQNLGCSPSMDVMRFTDTTTEQNPNSPGTGGSTSTEQNMFAALVSVDQLVERIKPFLKKAQKRMPGESQDLWKELMAETFSTMFMGVFVIPANLSAVGMHMTKIPTDLMYETQGVACSEVELDVCTGESRVLSTNIAFDMGMSYNPMVDMGQLEGAFIMGMGHVLQEGMDYDKATGKCLTDNTWSYKPPIACDIPEKFDCDFVDMTAKRKNAGAGHECIMGCVAGIMACFNMPWKASKLENKYKSAKAIGEPPLLLAQAVHSAHFNAIVAARGGQSLPDHLLPIPAKPFVTLPLMATAKPGSANAGQDSESTKTPSSAA